MICRSRGGQINKSNKFQDDHSDDDNKNKIPKTGQKSNVDGRLRPYFFRNDCIDSLCDCVCQSIK